MKKRSEQISEGEIGKPAVLSNQKCPICGKNTLTLVEAEREIPYFGRVSVYSMDCSNCNFHKADVESYSTRKSVKHTIEIKGADDLSIRVVKSATASVKIPRIIEITPGPASNGYITNIEGILRRILHQLEETKETEENRESSKKIKAHIKKIRRAMNGQETIKLIIEDPEGNSAIVSDRTIKK